jgi:hypothetical protein
MLTWWVTVPVQRVPFSFITGARTGLQGSHYGPHIKIQNVIRRDVEQQNVAYRSDIRRMDTRGCRE